jgi:hypothetical protein
VITNRPPISELAPLRHRQTHHALLQLGRHVHHIDIQIKELDRQLHPLVASRAPELVTVHGVGVEVASSLLVAGVNAASHSFRSCLRFALRCSPCAGQLQARPTDVVLVVPVIEQIERYDESS